MWRAPGGSLSSAPVISMSLLLADVPGNLRRLPAGSGFSRGVTALIGRHADISYGVGSQRRGCTG
jgi:hypothetical protein